MKRLLVLALLLASPAHAVFTPGCADSVCGVAPLSPYDIPWTSIGWDGGYQPVVYLGNRWVLGMVESVNHLTKFLGVTYTVEAGTNIAVPDYAGIYPTYLYIWRLEQIPPVPAVPLLTTDPAVGELVVQTGVTYFGSVAGPTFTQATSASMSPVPDLPWVGTRTGWQLGSVGALLRWGTTKITSVPSYRTRAYALYVGPGESPTTYESVGLPYDSGGPAFIKRGSTWYLLGVYAGGQVTMPTHTTAGNYDYVYPGYRDPLTSNAAVDLDSGWLNVAPSASWISGHITSPTTLPWGRR